MKWWQILGLALVAVTIVALGWVVGLEADAHFSATNVVTLMGVALTFFTASLAALVSWCNSKEQRETDKAIIAIKARVEQVTPKEVEAYFTVWAAVTRYYRALSSLERGVPVSNNIDEAEKRCNDAEAAALLVDDEDEELFFEYWQMARNLSEKARKLSERTDGRTKEQIQSLWTDGGARDLAKIRSRIKAGFSARVQGKKNSS